MIPIYTIHHLQQQYDKRIILNIDALSIRHGEIFALVGPSGAGKSTLLRLLAMLEAPTTGTVNLHLHQQNYDYEGLPIQVRREIAMVFQRPVLLTRSVRANVAYGLTLRGEKARSSKVDAMLERLSILHLADAKPRTLSGGELQRVSIARAMILQPQVLILDEPTANLDPHNIGIIEQFLRDQHTQQQTTIIIVTHNIFQAKRLADRIGLLYDGNLIEVADTQTFFENPHDERTAAFTSGHLIY
ncbi:MAG: phosphate ABC transporter ATP-binding protein [Phototrophicaceae bacterium]